MCHVAREAINEGKDRTMKKQKMSKGKKALIITAVLLVLAAIGNAMPQESTQGADTAAGTDGKQATTAAADSPTAKLDYSLDDVKVDSYSVDDDGVTLNLSYDSDKNNYVQLEITYLHLGKKSVRFNYDSSTDKYVADGFQLEQDGKPNDMGLIQLQGGSKTTVKFSADDAKKASDYDTFEAHFDMNYSGSWRGTIKDDYVKVSF